MEGLKELVIGAGPKALFLGGHYAGDTDFSLPVGGESSVYESEDVEGEDGAVSSTLTSKKKIGV